MRYLRKTETETQTRLSGPCASQNRVSLSQWEPCPERPIANILVTCDRNHLRFLNVCAGHRLLIHQRRSGCGPCMDQGFEHAVVYPAFGGAA